nr:redoxin domain-containing protein [Myxococcota bacterium]
MRAWAFAVCVALAAAAVIASSAALAQPRSLIGLPAPAFRARPLEGGGEVTLASMRGSVVLLAFVASWCGACREVEPQLAE